MEKETKKFNKKRIIIAIAVPIVFIFSTIFAFINMNNSNIISGVSIEGVEVSGLSREEAKEKLQLIYDEQIKKEITLKHDEYEKEITPETIDTKYEIEKAVEEAQKMGRTGNIFTNNYTILFTAIGKKKININITTDQELESKLSESIIAEIPGTVQEADYYVEDDKLVITNGKEGIVVDSDKLAEEIHRVLYEKESKQAQIEIPTILTQPQKIDIDKIHEEVYKEVQNASFTKDPFELKVESDGIDFDVEAAKKMIEEYKEEYIIQLTITKPTVTIADIGAEALPDKLSTFTTRYDASNTDRTTNLAIACNKLNGVIVMPDETLSYNKTLGERSTATGFKNAKVYSNGEVVDGIGGGICQISSTLYNAVLMANLEVIERRNHQFPAGYVEPGRDATVVYGLTDFKFKNTRKYPIKIQAGISNGIATISIYGLKEEQEYTISFDSKTLSTIPNTVKYIEDNTLPAGTEKIKQYGYDGCVVETYIIKRLNGKVVSRELLSKDTYNPMQRIIIKSSKELVTEQKIETKVENKKDIKIDAKTETKTDTSNKTNTIIENRTTTTKKTN